MLLRITTLLLTVMLVSCTPAKRYAQVDYGQAGGVTGDKKHYIVKENGELHCKNDSNSDLVLVKKLTKAEQKKLYKLLADADVDNLELNEPHNIYCYLELKEKADSPPKKLVWGHPKTKISDEMQALQDYLFSLDKNVK